MKTTLPVRIRIARFIEERYVHRARPLYLPELAVFGLIVLVTIWPLMSLAAAMELVR